MGRVYHGEVSEEGSKIGHHPLHCTSLLVREEDGEGGGCEGGGWRGRRMKREEDGQK